MSLSYYEGKRPRSLPTLLALMWANALFAAAVVFGWAFLAWVIAEPTAWAARTPIPHRSTPDLFEYPFLLLWAMPAAGVAGAWVAEKLGRRGLAYAVALLPILYFNVIFGWFYLSPAGLR
jgi:hypothetical protein